VVYILPVFDQKVFLAKIDFGKRSTDSELDGIMPYFEGNYPCKHFANENQIAGN
jgi:hypothetical protein